MKTVRLRDRLRIYYFVFATLAIFINFNARSQCVATVSQSPTLFENDASVGSLSFNNPSFAGSPDANKASATALVVLFSGNSHYLKLTGFNFNISPLASICGVMVEMENNASGVGIGWIRDNEVKLVKNGVVSGTNLGKECHVFSGYGHTKTRIIHNLCC